MPCDSLSPAGRGRGEGARSRNLFSGSEPPHPVLSPPGRREQACTPRSTFPAHWRMPQVSSFSRRTRARGLPSQSQLLPPKNKGRRSADRRTIRWPHLRVRPRTLRRRARLSALHRGAWRSDATPQPRPRFPRCRGRRCYLRRVSRLSEAPRAPVVMPAGSMPGPPGSGVTSPARRYRTRPISRLSPVTPLRRARQIAVLHKQ
jgi:hypothetical protein